ncbi:hypothetical protein LOAG_15980 [Loa loa]|uniref:Uncharacterized protein n=1 Tax=Loa loa TaxID=7209 RepID=A0A1S0TEJ1_LOALO|nr:hypothetical protein LOAG_15980 [Loa loa]EFO12554.1 hypothetical protein LOAG_15980 [Loa loa]
MRGYIIGDEIAKRRLIARAKCIQMAAYNVELARGDTIRQKITHGNDIDPNVSINKKKKVQEIGQRRKNYLGLEEFVGLIFIKLSDRFIATYQAIRQIHCNLLSYQTESLQLIKLLAIASQL